MSDVEAVPEVHPASTSTLAASGNALLSDEGSAPTPDQAAADAAVKQTLHRYLQKHRAALLAKLDGLAERQARWPVTPTGTNVLGLVKHVAGVQAGYFGEVFGRPLPDPPAWLESEDGDDMFAPLDETMADVVAFHHRSAAHADATIEALDLTATGTVSWWPEEHRHVTLHRILVHMAYETARHAGHADIVREMLDGLAGDGDGNLADKTPDEWVRWREQLVDIAERAGLRDLNA
ncbi:MULTISPECIES: DinB family protein [Curtobacterium]|uniref:DinB family protein n=1 Tax=Curtobacterium TaxID=2034 RepID=UPI0011271F56|nr:MULTISPECIES: DinB family protein [Curtobacterium]MBF4598236.1 DinB family protein [Curtobacterium sp. VKM Ac-1796]MBF4610331.1 DinB family protein [Curtobacterium sp. VKM Ac-2889]TPG06895.1 DinB family protein [Curtobacterium flaccumfaciens]